MDAPEEPQPPTPTASTGMSLWATMLVVGCLMLLGIAILNWRGEVARWHWAAAREHYLGQVGGEGDLPAALAELDIAAEYDPQNYVVLFERCQLRLQAKDYQGALADCDEVERRLLPTDAHAVLMQRAEILQRMGKHREAIAELDRCVALIEQRFAGQNSRESQNALARALNNRAYFRARANLELPAAMDDIERALALIDIFGDSPTETSPAFDRFLGGTLPDRTSAESLERIDTAVGYLDTRAYLRFLGGDAAGALADLDMTLALAEASYNDQYARLMTESKMRYDTRQIDGLLRSMQQNLAVIYHHRGQARENLGHLYAAGLDLQRAKQLGYNPADGVW